MKGDSMDKLTSITLKKQSSGLFTVNVRGYREGNGYHDKPRRFTGVFIEDFEESIARAMVKLANRPFVELYWNEELTGDSVERLERLANELGLGAQLSSDQKIARTKIDLSND